MNQKLLEKVLECPRLPSLPSVAVEVIDLCRDDNAAIKQIAETISNDPALSSKILKTVNSSYYGLRKQITTISHAIVILGLNCVKTLALSFSLVSTFKDTSGKNFDPNTFWQRVLYAATSARTIAEHLQMIDQQEEVFLGGLLQDLGVLAMMQELGGDYISLLVQSQNDHSELSTLEEEKFDLNHAAVGAAMAEKWKLPRILIDPIRYHNTPNGADSEYPDVVRAVALGNLAAPIFLQYPPVNAFKNFMYRAKQWFGISNEDAEALLTRIDEAAKELGKFFEISREGANELGDILVQASEVMLEVTMQAQQDHNRLLQENKSLEQKATRDALTGVTNRGYFNDQLQLKFEHAQRQLQPLSLILFDADHFKSVNDTHGHLAGDKVLIELARRVEQTMPDHATVSRYGGEEFIIILPNTTRADAAILAEKIRMVFDATPFQIEGDLQLNITASLGVASFDGVNFFRNPEQLIKATDQAVYAAKSGGRNCVRVFAPRIPQSS